MIWFARFTLGLSVAWLAMIALLIVALTWSSGCDTAACTGRWFLSIFGLVWGGLFGLLAVPAGIWSALYLTLQQRVRPA